MRVKLSDMDAAFWKADTLQQLNQLGWRLRPISVGDFEFRHVDGRLLVLPDWFKTMLVAAFFRGEKNARNEIRHALGFEDDEK